MRRELHSLCCAVISRAYRIGALLYFTVTAEEFAADRAQWTLMKQVIGNYDHRGG